MSARFSLALPYVLFALAVAFIVWNASDTILPEATRASEATVHLDPVCGMEVAQTIASIHGTDQYFFCAQRCLELFTKDPERYLVDTCLVCKTEGIHTPIEQSDFPATWDRETYQFCTAVHRDSFQSDPAGYFMHTMWGVPPWLYYSSIAVVLILSFLILERRGKSKETFQNALTNPTDHELIRQSRPRFDLLQFSTFRALVVHPMTRFVVRAGFVGMFILVIAAGLFGNQLPGKNIAPLLTWTIWWGGLILVILYAGSLWCYVCPWQAIAEWAEGLRFWGRSKNGLSLGLKWPRFMRNVWPAIFLFMALTWVELGFGVTLNPRATAYLALGITGLAFASAFIFDRASFCRYGCFVGRIIGLYSQFSPIEVRAKSLEACRTCGTKSCYKGNENGNPCPTFQYLPGMQSSTNCIGCMECVKTCEKENVAVSLRPWGEDLNRLYHPRSDEAALALILLALTGFHGFTMTGWWQRMLGWLESDAGLGYVSAFSVGMMSLVVVPVLVYAVLVYTSWLLGASKQVSYRDYFVRYAYALLPIALFYHLAHNSEHLLLEGQKVLPLLADPLGLGWNWFAGSATQIAPLVSLSTLWIIQVGLVLIGHVYSLHVARNVAGQLFSSNSSLVRSQLPMLVAMILFSITSLWLLKQPMQMRMSAM